jgi:putative membrane protein
MGIAEVIPGVSGGTIAFITNIYERLLASIQAILGPELLRSWKQGGIKATWAAVDGRFLTFLLLGMATGLISGVFGITHLLEKQPRLVWAFFFGLILASSWFVGKQVKSWNVTAIGGLIVGTAVALWYTLAAPGQGSEALWFVFISGVIAISALMLPGISGSFMLVLMGMYTLIIPSLKSVLQNLDSQSLVIIATFAVGCLVGLASFSRVLTWLFKHYHDLTMAVLTGFMIGSLNKIWPWRIVLETRVNSAGEEVPVFERSVLPGDFPGDPQLLWVLVFMAVGVAIVLFLEKASIVEGDGTKKDVAG